MPDKLVLRGTTDADDQSETSLSEEGVRQALARLGRGMGEGTSGPGGDSSQHDTARNSDPFRQNGGSHQNGGGPGLQRRAASPMHKLKRPAFVQDGDVVVEYAGRDRQSHGSGHQGGHHDGSDQGRNALDAVRDELARERRTREEAERSLAETRLALQGAQTRLAHLELDLNEARTSLRLAQEEAVSVVARQAAPAAPPPAAVPSGEDAAPVVTVPSPAPAAAAPPRVRRLQAKPRVGGREPQPVKWWIKSKV